MENKIENDQGLNDDNKRMSTYVNGKKNKMEKKKLDTESRVCHEFVT